MEAIVQKISTCEADINNLKGWQKKQNGTIRDVDQKVDKLQYWIMVVTFTTALNLLGVVFILLGE